MEPMGYADFELCQFGAKQIFRRSSRDPAANVADLRVQRAALGGAPVR